MSFNLGRIARQWNAIGTTDRTSAAKVRHAHSERVCCELMAELDASELRVLLAIQARTLRFHKFAESIALSQFCTGLRDIDGDLILDGSDAPYFAGCNIAKMETVSLALTRLEGRGLITRWRMGHRSTSVYMPFAESWLVAQLVYVGGAIAPDYDFIVPGEHFRACNGDYFKVLDTPDDPRIVLEPVSARLGWRDGDRIAVASGHMPDAGLRRLTVEEILGARRHRNGTFGSD